jgi:hypothetical protein
VSAPAAEFDPRTLTPDQLEAGIENALKARDFQAVEGFMLLLALKDPHRAAALRDSMLAVLHALRGAR